MPQIELLHTDCMEYMAGLPDRSFGLAIVDPPYGIGAYANGTMGGGVLAKQSRYKATEWDAAAPSQEYFMELRRVSVNQIVWGANHFITSMPLSSPCWIVWNKQNGENNFADAELAWTSFPSAVRMFSFRWQGMLQGNMAEKEYRIHPTQKPVALYDWIYKNYLPNGGRVIDTHLGSGSNRIAADKAGNIDFTAFEIDKDYFDAQEKRFRDYKAQGVLF